MRATRKKFQPGDGRREEQACADPRRPHGWINRAIRDAYRHLHELGWAHSVEAWTPEGELAGGLYGLAIGGLFAGESMFHRRTDAAKVARSVGDFVPITMLLSEWTRSMMKTLGKTAFMVEAMASTRRKSVSVLSAPA